MAPGLTGFSSIGRCIGNAANALTTRVGASATHLIAEQPRVGASATHLITEQPRAGRHISTAVQQASAGERLTKTPWYQRATIYEVNTRSFCDSNADGVGDIAGLTSKLGYLDDLGVDAVWMLPINKSPMRDGGYDVADFLAIQDEFGTLDDFRNFVAQAHERDIKVIIEFPLNHTSIDHDWFQRARRAPKGSPERNYYVWSDSPDRFADAPVNMPDFESSNWAWDDVAGQYYWHRWKSHQPDLNWDSPDVMREMKRTIDFWMDMGVDGMRIDAAPYLVEREGTICESLPETHAILRELRAHIDSKYDGRMLLAEANQHPTELKRYFGSGTGDEMHMAFNFPVMPRVYEALKRGDSTALVQAVEATEGIPRDAAWATFLRNHDELSLGMVDDVTTEFMLREYAPNMDDRILGGIRKRLATLMDNDPKKIRLINAMHFSLPGTPVVYYGDEIGMAERAGLFDRDAVRTPMQWTPEPVSAGFSTAPPDKFPFPITDNPTFAPPRVNVESQMNDPDSLFNWMKAIISNRKAHPALQTGAFRNIDTGDSSVLAFTRTSPDEQVMAAFNLTGERKTIALNAQESLRSFRLSKIDGTGEISPELEVTLEPWEFGRWQVN